LSEETCYTYVVAAYRVAGLRVNTLKDNIEMGITKIELMLSGLNVINI